MDDNEKPGTSKQKPGSTTDDSSSPLNSDPSTSGKKNNGEVDHIDIVNNLQNKLIASGHSLDVALPQIVVVGSQSAGKSSVLESFVGREFLPRGKDTVTRRPTIVQMFPYNEEYAVFAHKPDKKFTDFEKVKEEIQAETLRHPGCTGFSADPISLKIYSPRVLKLTVVDLPGLIKDVEDGHSQTAVQEVRNMVLKEITPLESIILAVTPATQEIVTSDAMEIAKQVDPKRERTIGVITKLDALIDGTDAKDVLENRKIYLSKGYVGVVNRSQKEIEQKKDFQYILKKERDFFAKHPAYKDIADVHGIPYLTSMLQKTLRAHIKHCLSSVRSEISQKLTQYKKEIRNFEKRLGEDIGSSKVHNKQYYIIKLLQNFIRDIDVQLMGNSEMIDSDKFSAGAMINYKLCTEVQKNLTLTMVPDEAQASLLIVNMSGLRTSISIPDLALHSLNRILLNQYKGPMEDSVRSIQEILKFYMADSAKSLERYTQLKNEVLFYINNCIDKEADITIERLLAHIEANMYYINYSHPDFDSSVCDPVAPPAGPIKLWENAAIEENITIDTTVNPETTSAQGATTSVTTSITTSHTVKVPNKEQMLQALKVNESNQKNVKYASTLLMKNLEHVQKQILDVAIKYIVYFLVKKVLDFIKTELLGTILGASNFVSLMEDCDSDFRWKEETEATCQILESALHAICNF